MLQGMCQLNESGWLFTWLVSMYNDFRAERNRMTQGFSLLKFEIPVLITGVEEYAVTTKQVGMVCCQLAVYFGSAGLHISH
jgi:hypothetical protein